MRIILKRMDVNLMILSLFDAKKNVEFLERRFKIYGFF